MLKKIFIIITLLFSVFNYSQNKNFKDYKYQELITECNLIIKVPRGFREVNIIKDNGHLYQYSLQDSTTGFQARYYIKPYKLFFPKNDNTFINNPTTYNFFLSSLLNVTGNTYNPEIIEINPEYVKYDMNADYGLFSILETGSKFSEGFKYFEAHAIRKNKIGEVFIFMLYNTQNRETRIIRDDILSSIDFK